MDISCSVCGKVRTTDAYAASKINRKTYRCRQCFLAASGTEIVVCDLCGKVRKLFKPEALRRKSDRCMDCQWAEMRRKGRVALVCPRCGKTKVVKKCVVRQGTLGYCRGCQIIYDKSIPDTFNAGYVTGVMMGDGCFRPQKNGNSLGFVLRLDVKSEAFARKFRDVASQCTGNSGWVGTYHRVNKANPKISMPAIDAMYWLAVIGSREWYEKLQPIKKAKDWSRLEGFGDEFARGFVDGMVDSEGYVNEKYTDIAGKDVGLLLLTEKYLKQLGYKTKIYKPYSYSRGVSHLRVKAKLGKTR